MKNYQIGVEVTDTLLEFVNLNITAPDVGVDLTWSDDERTVWVSVDGMTVLRIHQIPALSFNGTADIHGAKQDE